MSPSVTALLCMLCATMLGTMVFGFITGLHGMENDRMIDAAPWLSLLVTGIAAVLVLLVLRKSMQLDRLRFGSDRQEWKPLQYGAAALAGASAGHVWSTLISLFGIPRLFPGYEETVGRVFAGQPLPLLLFCTVAAAPVAEELVFRYMTYRRAKLYLGTVPAVLLTGLLFGIYHANVVQLIYVFGFNFLLIFLYEKSGNILAPILAHSAANLWAVVLDRIAENISSTASVPLTAAELLLGAVCIWICMRNRK